LIISSSSKHRDASILFQGKIVLGTEDSSWGGLAHSGRLLPKQVLRQVSCKSPQERGLREQVTLLRISQGKQERPLTGELHVFWKRRSCQLCGLSDCQVLGSGIEVNWRLGGKAGDKTPRFTTS
jgi:hypothetical protein